MGIGVYITSSERIPRKYFIAEDMKTKRARVMIAACNEKQSTGQIKLCYHDKLVRIRIYWSRK